MRLQLTLLVLASLARGEPKMQLESRTALYRDSDRTLVSTTVLGARGEVKGRLSVEAQYLVDVVTAASIDVVTAATGPFRDVRHQMRAALAYHDGDNRLAASYTYSIENDWESHAGSLRYSRELLRHNLTFGIGGSFVWNQISKMGDRFFQRQLGQGGGQLSLAWTVTPRDVLDLSYGFSYLAGFQASPYRFAIAGGRALWETAPDTRTRHVLTLRYNRHLFSDTALRSHLRGYLDDWGVLALTAGLEYVVGFGPLDWGIHARGYAQRHADFYAPTYAQVQPYMSADRELSTFVDVFGGMDLGYRRRFRRIEELSVEVRVDGFAFWFFDFPRLPFRGGVVAELGISLAL